MRTNLIKIASLCFVLAACSSTGVRPIGKDTYMDSRTRSGFASGGECLADLYEDATDYCTELNLEFVPIHEQSKDGIPGRALATATLKFRCLPASDPEYKRPDLKPDAQTIIQNTNIIENKPR